MPLAAHEAHVDALRSQLEEVVSEARSGGLLIASDARTAAPPQPCGIHFRFRMVPFRRSELMSPCGIVAVRPFVFVLPLASLRCGPVTG